MGKESKKEWIYVYVQMIHFAHRRNQYNIVNQLYNEGHHIIINGSLYQKDIMIINMCDPTSKHPNI